MKQIHMPTNLNECSKNENDACEKCRGLGWKLISDGGQGTFVECECGIEQRRIAKNRHAFANLPESFRDMTMDSFDTMLYKDHKSQNKAQNALKAIKYWLNDFEAMHERGMGLYLYSKTKGSGKTRMAAGIANAIMDEKHIQVKFCTSIQILNEIKASWDGENVYTESRLLDFLSTTKVLIIDDFGTEQSDKTWINERFYQIINNRYVDKKVTIFTSNERLEDLKYDDRITNRIKERVFQIPFPEESVRDIIAQENMQELIQGIKRAKEV